MKYQIISLDWFNTFRCIGGPCPFTCCSAHWKIELKDSEIKAYQEMEHPFREELLREIDFAGKRMKTRGDGCAMLTEDGWCRLVRACGEESLSTTCQMFPRRIVQYGDIIEKSVEIACPVVAEYLFSPEPLCFHLVEEEREEIIPEVDVSIYDSLAGIRNVLIDMVQSNATEEFAGKVYILFELLYQIRERWQIEKLTPDLVEELLEGYTEKEVERIFASCREISVNNEAKVILLQSLVRLMTKLLKKDITESFLIQESLQETIDCWMTDGRQFEQAIRGFIDYVHVEYPMLFDNYLVYSLFVGWIELDRDRFGYTICGRYVSFALAQLFAMALWSRKEQLTVSEYALMLCSVDRAIRYSSDFMDVAGRFVDTVSRNGIVNILPLLIW